MKKSTSFTCAALMGIAVSFSAEAVVWNSWTGKGDPNRPFSDEKNWTAPVANTRIQSFKCDLYITNDVEAAAFASIEMWYMANSGNVIWALPTNATCGAHLYDASGTGAFIKRGKTTLQMAPVWVDRYDCWGKITVEEGVLRLPDYTLTAKTPNQSDYSYNVAVSNGATLVLAKRDDTTSITHNFSSLQVAPEGLVTNDLPGVRHSIRVASTEENPSRVYGRIGGNIEIAGDGSIYLYNEKNSFTSLNPLATNPKRPVYVGLKYIGNKADLYSSLGYGSDLSLSYIPNYGGVIFKYLGDGESTDRQFKYGYASLDYPARGGLDGGPNGGLRMSGMFQPSVATDKADALDVDLVLQGDNAKPCEIDSCFGSASQHKNRNVSVTHITKRGTGAWRFNHRYDSSTSGRVCTYNGLTGGISVEEGTIQFEDYGDEGEFCSLGAGVWCDQFGEYQGVRDYTKLVPWTYSLGTVDDNGVALTEGTFECVATNLALSSRRPFVLQGNGRFKSSGSGRLCLRDVKPRSAGEKVLTLDGTNTLANTATEISDSSVAGAVVSVAKEGSGTWVLNGNQTFHGDLVVKAGTLEVNADTNAFSWFKFTQTEGGSYIRLSELGFYDKDGNRVNKGLTHPANIPNPSAGGTKGFLYNDYGELNPGECTYGRLGPYMFYTSSGGPKRLFDGSTTDATIHLDVGSDPTVTNSRSQVSVAFRLKTGSAEVASYDIGFGNYQYWYKQHPRGWRIEGSRDGVAWEVLTNVVGYTDVPTTDSVWYSDKTSVAASGARPYPTCGFPLKGNSTVSSLPNVRSVKVLPGATLKTTYANVGAIRKLTVGSSGTGTIDGFAFAEEGTLDIESAGDLAVGTIPLAILNSPSAANLANWSVTVNGAANAKYQFTPSASGIAVAKQGMIFILK